MNLLFFLLPSAIGYTLRSGKRGSLPQQPFLSCSRMHHEMWEVTSERRRVLATKWLCSSLLTPHQLPLTTVFTTGIGLADLLFTMGTMTRQRWLLLGAVGLGLAIAIYFIFFCPADCQ
jgi:hypothetical protein